jgi:hypothetical protein
MAAIRYDRRTNMLLIALTLTFSNAFLSVLQPVNAFSSPSSLVWTFQKNIVGIRASRFVTESGHCHSPSSSHFYAQDDDNNEASSAFSAASTTTTTTTTTTTSWTMEQDWALIDQLPKFTVIGDGEKDTNHHIRTFWAQLAACTPSLSDKTPNQVLERCQELERSSLSLSSSSSKTNHDATTSTHPPPPPRKLLVFGPSPPQLQNWMIDLDHRDGKAVGQTQDGRTIWLRYHSIGRLEGDPFSDISSSSVLSLVPGGYLEAVGGRIYELGEPRQESSSSISSTTSSSSISSRNHNNDKTDDIRQEEKLDWWIPPATATMSALLASTVLSACIGYGAGLSIIFDGSSSISSPAFSTDITTSTKTNTRSSSLEEQRVRTEYRIYNERRLLQTLSDRLEQDQQQLLELRQQPQPPQQTP